MATKIVINVEGVELKGEFFDTPGGQALAQGLPIECRWSRWGDEYYGNTTPSFGHYQGEETEVLDVGDLAYHGETGWFCLFFGPTPASHGQEPRAAAPVQKVGRVEGDWSAVKALGHSITARVEAA